MNKTNDIIVSKLFKDGYNIHRRSLVDGSFVNFGRVFSLAEVREIKSAVRTANDLGLRLRWDHEWKRLLRDLDKKRREK